MNEKKTSKFYKKGYIIFFIVLIVILGMCIIVGVVFATIDLVAIAKSKVSGGMDASIGLYDQFPYEKLTELSKALAIKTYGETAVNANPDLIESCRMIILDKYKLTYGAFWYNLANPIEFPGTFIMLLIVLAGLMVFCILLLLQGLKQRKAILESEKAKQKKDELFE